MRSISVKNTVRSWSSLLVATFATAIALSTPKAVHAQIITNGGFELPATAPAGNFITLTGTQLTGWTIASGTSIDLINTGFWPSYSGAQSIDLDGTGGSHPAGTITQTFATFVGYKYVLSFEYANNYSAPGAVGALVTVTDSSSNVLLSNTITHMSSSMSNMNYTQFTGTFVADTTSTTLSFASTDPASSQTGIALDAVSVTAVAPEPSALPLAAFGALPVGMLLRRPRRNNKALRRRQSS